MERNDCLDSCDYQEARGLKGYVPSEVAFYCRVLKNMKRGIKTNREKKNIISNMVYCFRLR